MIKIVLVILFNFANNNLSNFDRTYKSPSVTKIKVNMDLYKSDYVIILFCNKCFLYILREIFKEE